MGPLSSCHPELGFSRGGILRQSETADVVNKRRHSRRAPRSTTGIAFAVLVVLHILRAIKEGPPLLKEPPFIITIALAAALFVSAMSLLRRSPRV